MSVLFPQTYNYLPYSSSTKVKGRVTVGYGSSTIFSGNVQPMSQKEVDSLDIGRKDLGKIKIYTDQVFTISEEGKENTGDIIIYDSAYYEVIKLDHHTGTLLPHRKYIAELRTKDEFSD